MSFSTTHSESEYCMKLSIKGDDLAQFYKINTGHSSQSKSFTINRIGFHVYLYPNGHKKEESGYVQFMLTTDKFDSTIKSVTVCCKMYCETLQIMFKEVKILQKGNDRIQWSPHQLQLSECKHITINNAILIKSLDFVCDVQILKISHKSSPRGIGRKLSLHSRRKSSANSDTSLSSIDINVFQPGQPQSCPVKSHVDIEWTITKDIIDLFTNAPNGRAYYSQDINNLWCLCVFPNGSNSKNNGFFELVIKLIHLPPEIKSIQADFEVQYVQLNQTSETVSSLLQIRDALFSYHQSESVLRTLFETRKLKEFGVCKLRFIIKIKKICQDTGKDKGNGKEITDSWSRFGFDEFKPGLFECNIDYGQVRSNNDYSRNSFMETIVIDENIGSNSSPKIRPYQRKISYTSLTPPTMNTLSSRTTSKSITYLSQSSQSNPCLNNIVENKQGFVTDVEHKISIQDWEEKTEIGTEMDIFQQKLELWLRSIVKKKQYLNNFLSNGADIRSVHRFDEQTLIQIGIHNMFDRQIILDEVKAFTQTKARFEELMGKHEILRSFRKHFKENGVLTIDDINIGTREELQKVLNMECEDQRIDTIFNIFHPSQSVNVLTNVSPLQMRFNKCKDEYELFQTEMDTFQSKMCAMNIQMKSVIQMSQQKGEMLNSEEFVQMRNDYGRRLLDLGTIIDGLLERNDEYKSFKMQRRPISQSDKKEKMNINAGTIVSDTSNTSTSEEIVGSCSHHGSRTVLGSKLRENFFIKLDKKKQ